jgi:hypothetical protein
MTNTSGIDFDYCSILTDKLIAQTAFSTLKTMQETSYKYLWIRINIPYGRKITKLETVKRVNLLNELITLHQNNFLINQHRTLCYYDTWPMMVRQIIYERKEKMKKNMKTIPFSRLSDKQKDMVRTLTTYDYTSEEIAKVFHISINSVAAVKANKTKESWS